MGFTFHSERSLRSEARARHHAPSVVTSLLSQTLLCVLCGENISPKFSAPSVALCFLRGALFLSSPHPRHGNFAPRMIPTRHLALLFLATLCSLRLPAQTEPNPTPPNPWTFNASISGYLVPQGQSYASPTFTADHNTLHLEARYNYEAQRTASLWVGYNWSWGKKFVLDATPMIGGVFGNVDGVAPGLEFTVTYKKLQLYSANEYIFDTGASAHNFFYTWTQLTYSPRKWFTVGYVVQRTRAYHTPLDIQRGLLVGFTRKKLSFTTQFFNIGETDPTVVLSLGYSF